MSLPTRRRASLKVTKRALSAAFARGLPVCPSFVDRESRAAASAPHDSHRVPQNRASARNQSRSSRDTRRYVGGTWRDTGKPEILGIARELWQRGVGDRRLAAGCRSTLLGSRTITQWDCARESAAGIRESHVFVESATYGPATSRYGGREGGREGGARETGKGRLRVFRDAEPRLYPQSRRDFIARPGHQLAMELPCNTLARDERNRRVIRCTEDSALYRIPYGSDGPTRDVSNDSFIAISSSSLDVSRASERPGEIKVATRLQCCPINAAATSEREKEEEPERNGILQVTSGTRTYLACINGSGLIIP